MTAFAPARFPPVVDVAAAARRYVRRCLRRLGRAELLPAAERGVAQLAAACQPAQTVTVQCFADPVDGTVRITVSDDTAVLPLAWAAMLRAAAGARAARLLGVAGRCGVDIDGAGAAKTLWFEPAASDPTSPS